MTLQFAHLIKGYIIMTLQFAHVIKGYIIMTLQFAHVIKGYIIMTLQFAHVIKGYIIMTLQFAHVIKGYIKRKGLICLVFGLERQYQALILRKVNIIPLQNIFVSPFRRKGDT
jgi:hypothetical protein